MTFLNLTHRSAAVLIAAATAVPTTACTFGVSTGDARTAHPSASPATVTGAAHVTIADYIREADIAETPVHRGDETAPSIELPALAGWVDATAQAGENTYVAVKYAGDDVPATDYTPNVVVLLSRLTGRVIDADKILAVAPGEVRNLTGYEPYGSPKTERLAGYPAYKISATYDLDGTPAVVGQSTVVIPGNGVSYIAQISVTGARTQESIVKAAAQAVDRGLRIRT